MTASEETCDLQPEFQLKDSIKGKFGFVMEQQVGMKTYYQNWRRGVENIGGVDATWVPINYYRQHGMSEKMKFIPGSLRAIISCLSEIREGLGNDRYDALLFNTFNPALIDRRTARKQPNYIVFDVTPIQYDRMSEWYGHKVGKNTLVNRYKHERVKETLQNANGLFAWSSWAGNSAIEDYGVPPERMHILPPGVDTTLWHPLPAEKRPADGTVRILFTGFDFERKGGELLLKWATSTSKKNWEIHIATREMQEVPTGVFVHTGLKSNSNELVELAQKSDIFVLPTRADCFSLVSLEAMAVGMPVLTTTVGGISEIVRENETGFLVPPDDYDSFHDRLDRLVEDGELRVKMGQRGREVVCSKFNAFKNVYKGLKIMAGS